jgi:hypothetical protein
MVVRRKSPKTKNYYSKEIEQYICRNDGAGLVSLNFFKKKQKKVAEPAEEDEDVVYSKTVSNDEILKSKLKNADVIDVDYEDEPPKKTQKKSVKKQTQKMMKQAVEAVEAEDKVDVKKNQKTPLVSSVSQFLGTLGMMDCKEMKAYLEKNKEMSVDQKIKFLEQNTKSHRELKAYVVSQHWDVKNLTFFSRACNYIVSELSSSMRSAVEYLMPQESEETDPDCLELSELLKDLKKQKKASSSSTWKETAWEALKLAGKVLEKTLMLGGATLYVIGYGIHTIISTLFSYGFNLYTWITKDPKIAKYTLFTLVIIKRRCCRSAGQFLSEHQLITKDYFDNEVKGNKMYGLKKKGEKEDDVSVKWKVTETIAKDAALDASGKIVTKSMIESAPKVGSWIGTAIGVFLVPYTSGASLGLGPLIGSCIGTLTQISMEEVAYAIEDAIAVGIFLENVDSAFGFFLDVINPAVCIKEMAVAYEKKEDDKEKKIKEDQKKLDDANNPSPKKGWFWDGKEMTRKSKMTKSKKLRPYI